jgi:hypothetical protein
MVNPVEGYGGPAQPSPTIVQCLNGGLSWLEVEQSCSGSNSLTQWTCENGWMRFQMLRERYTGPGN